MKKYQVIITLDRLRDRSYYHSYVESNDATTGNIECNELPPYADVTKARACYWDSNKKMWIFDLEKYNETLQAQEQAKIEAEKENAKNAAIPTNTELSEGLIELAESVAQHNDALVELGEILVRYDDALAELGNLIASLKTAIENLRTENSTSTEQMIN